MAIDQVQEWRSDPVGRHRLRLYAAGRPTEWVSDGNAITEDPLSPAEVSPVVSPAPTQEQPWAVGSREDPVTAAPPVRPPGYYRNTARPDEVRYWDGAAWASPPADPAGDAGAPGIGGLHSAAPVATQAAPVQTAVVRESAAPGGPTVGEVPANWYPDPADRTRLRYWDGLGWTEQVLDERPTYP